MTTIFGKIINKELDAEIVFENERILAIKDINPQAPVHLLIMPKKEIPMIQKMEEGDLPLMSEMIAVAQKLAVENGVEDGYRLVINNGKDSGQEVFHLHLHLLGGRPLGKMG